MKDYINYTEKDFITDESFRDWVQQPNPELDSFWHSFSARYPEKTPEMLRARAFLLSLRYRAEVSPAATRERVFQQVLKRSRLPGNTSKGIITAAWLSRAAFWLLAYAAGAGLYVFAGEQVSTEETPAEAPALLTRATPSGEKLSLRLADSSEVKLNAGTTLRFPATFGQVREVFLDSGEAFFSVRKDSARPFLVHCGGLQVRVLGTSFNIKRQAADSVIRVAVTSGSVAVAGSFLAQPLQLQPSQVAICTADSAEVGTFNPEKETGWKEGLLIFEKADLPEIKARLEQWYGCKVTIGSTGKLRRKFTGKFRDAPLTEVLEGMAYASEIEWQLEDKSLILNPK